MKARIVPIVCVVDEAGCASNVSSTLARGLPMAAILPERTEPIAIVGSGPSVSDYLDELRGWPGHIWAINGAYDYLLGQDIVPDGFVGVDPLPGLAEYVQNPQPETTFYLASMCDPAVFDALNNHKVMVWHSLREQLEVPGGQLIVGGGSTAITRAPNLAHSQGYRDLTIYGADSSFRDRRYCYEDGHYREDSKAPVMWVDINGEGPFPTEIGLIKQVSQFGVILQQFNGTLKFKCCGLMDAYLRSPMGDEDSVELVDDDATADAA